MKKKIFLSLWVFAAMSILISCEGGGSKENKNGATVPVVQLKSITIDFPETYVADIQAIQFVEIKPRVSGYIEQIHIDEGKRTQKGQKLFTISSTEYNAAVTQDQANLKQAQAELKMSEFELDRTKRLVEKDIISPIRFEQAKAEFEVAQMKVRQAEAQLERSKANLAYTVVVSPCDGVVDRTPYKVGSLVDEQTLLTSVTDVSEVFAYFTVNEREYLEFRRAQLNGDNSKVLSDLELILPDGHLYPYTGRIETIEGDFDRNTGSIAFRARFPNPEGLLKHGVSGKIRRMKEMTDVLLVPQKSTFEIQDFTYVYIVDEKGLVSIRSFTPISRFGSFYVTEDLPVNTRIVYEGVQLVKDGAQIVPEMVDLDSILEEDKAKFNYK